MATVPGLQVGRIIHYVGRNGEDKEHLAGIITATHGDTTEVTFTLFLENHTSTGYTAVYDAECAIGTWHWPERV